MTPRSGDGSLFNYGKVRKEKKMETSNCFDEQRMISDKMILNAIMVAYYYPRICSQILSEEVDEAFVKVYNCLLDELIERGVMEC